MAEEQSLQEYFSINEQIHNMQSQLKIMKKRSKDLEGDVMTCLNCRKTSFIENNGSFAVVKPRVKKYPADPKFYEECYKQFHHGMDVNTEELGAKFGQFVQQFRNRLDKQDGFYLTYTKRKPMTVPLQFVNQG